MATTTLTLGITSDISAEPVTLIAKKAVLYIKNCDSTFTDYVDLKIGTAPTADQHAEVLRIYGGQFAVLPLVNSTSIDADGGIDGDVMVKAASASTLIEYALFYEA